MEIRLQALLVIQVLFLLRAIGQAPTVTSSLEQAGKEAACPGETVTLTCTVHDSTSLEWNFLGQNVRLTILSNMPGDTLYRDGFTVTLDGVGDKEITSSLTTVIQDNYNGSHVNCTDAHRNTITKVLAAAGIPSPPTGFIEESRAPMCNHTDVTFTWNSPDYLGKADVIKYTVTVSSSDSTYTSHTSQLTEQLLKESLPNGAMYQVHIVASNCIGDSSSMHLELYIIGCSSPPPPERGNKNSSCTGENSVVQYQCDNGLVLLGGSAVTCMEDGEWSPNPHELSCKVDCGIIDHFNNGAIIYNNNSTLEDSVISYSCSDGYGVQETNSSTCHKNGTWLPNPTDVCRVCSATVPPNSHLLLQVPTEGHGSEFVCQTTVIYTEGMWLNKTEGHTAVYFCQSTDGAWMNKTTTCSNKGMWTPEVECPKQDGKSIGIGYSINILLAAVMSSVVATALISLLSGCLLMWCIMTKRMSVNSTFNDQSPPMETELAMEPYYDDIRISEENVKISANAAYAKSGQQN